MLLLSVPLTLVVYFLELKASKVVEWGYRMLRTVLVQVKHPIEVVFYSNIIGGFSHVFFDMFTHKTFPYVFYPMVRFSNPAWIGFEAAIVVEALVVFCLRIRAAVDKIAFEEEINQGVVSRSLETILCEDV